MGIGDSMGKAAENAMEDLAQTSDPTDDAHVPEPGAEDDDIQVHSSISEGSNAADESAGAPTHGVPGPAGLPDPDPEELRADPSEGDQDPGTGLGRG
ncbi:hypothetical protein [Arthrobacter sp. NPDC056493]|uniref:hypothetical protein n=1 Tax=Arthrobacter sp. NPDC056493 TaxID=3345839 RepID=UPI003670C4EF